MPSVSAAVFRGDELLWQEALGLADVEASATATPDTQYRIGSITKTFTAVCVLQLRDAGRALARRPADAIHVPESAHGADARADARARLRAPARAARRDLGDDAGADAARSSSRGTADAEQVLAPGSWWHYSNLAFALLGEVVARADGGTWEEALQARVLDPLGLDAHDGRGRRARPRAATSSSRTATPCSSSRDPDLGGAGALGKLWSTTGDLARWGAFLAAGDDRVLAASTLEEMSHVRAMVDHERWTARLGHGARALPRGDHVFVGHGGAMPGHLAALVVNRKTKIGAAVLTNTGAGASPEKLALDLAVAAIEALPAPADAWRPGEAAPAGDRAAARPLVGRRAHEIVLRVAKGPARGEARRRPARARHVRTSRPTGEDRYRSVEGRERGELLRVVRDADGRGREALLRDVSAPPRALDLLALRLAQEEGAPRCRRRRRSGSRPCSRLDRPSARQHRRDHDGHAERERSRPCGRRAPAARSAGRAARRPGSGRPRPARSRQRAISVASLILPRAATTTAPPCSAALPTIAITTAARKNSLRPESSANDVDRADEDLGDERRDDRRERRARRARAGATSP